MADVRARPSPVFPEVGSISVSPFFILPYNSASKIILFPILSFTDPPALKNSHLASSSTSKFSDLLILFNLTKGVFPIISRAESAIFFGIGLNSIC